MQGDFSNFGIDWDQLPSSNDADVEFSEPILQCSEIDMEILQDNFDPLTPCTDYGVGTYLDVRNFLLSLH